MQHYGDDYYQAAKAARPIASLLDPASRKLQQTEASRTTEALAEAHRTLASRRGRKNAKTMALERDLFGPCKGAAAWSAAALQISLESALNLCHFCRRDSLFGKSDTRRPRRFEISPRYGGLFPAASA
jgi:hypothetical protein